MSSSMGRMTSHILWKIANVCKCSKPPTSVVGTADQTDGCLMVFIFCHLLKTSMQVNWDFPWDQTYESTVLGTTHLCWPFASQRTGRWLSVDDVCSLDPGVLTLPQSYYLGILIIQELAIPIISATSIKQWHMVFAHCIPIRVLWQKRAKPSSELYLIGDFVFHDPSVFKMA